MELGTYDGGSLRGNVVIGDIAPEVGEASLSSVSAGSVPGAVFIDGAVGIRKGRELGEVECPGSFAKHLI